MEEVFILSVLLVCVSATARQIVFPKYDIDPSCNCVPVVACDVYLNLLLTSRDEGLATLRRSACGFDGYSPRVCCPLTARVTPSPGVVPLPPQPPIPPMPRQPPITPVPNQPPIPPVLPPQPLPVPSPGISPPGSALLPESCGMIETGERILGGEEAPIGSHPWMVALGYSGSNQSNLSYLCAGSLINDRYILTAAHCLSPNDVGNRTLVEVRFGEWDFRQDPDCVTTTVGNECAPPIQLRRPQTIIIHPQYLRNSSIVINDIGLIRTDRPVEFNDFVQPLCLPPRHLRVGEHTRGREGIVAGWGETEFGGRNDLLLQARIPFVDIDSCNVSYAGSVFADQHLCLEDTGLESCRGDSGAPLVLPQVEGPPMYQLGIVSFSIGCGSGIFPVIYTSVYHFRNWIESSLLP